MNKKFYAELLHILGIEEKKENNKIVIVRKAVGQRNEASLLENTINQLDVEDCLRKFPILQFMEVPKKNVCSMWLWSYVLLGLIESCS